MIEIIVAFFATVAFSGLFNVPKEQYPYCGLCGSIGWLVYMILARYGHSAVMASFFATLVLTFVCRIFAVYRKMPITIFLIAGLFPLVPGAGIYFTAYYFIMNENTQALSKGLETVKIAIAIALGIVFIFSLPQRIFTLLASSK